MRLQVKICSGGLGSQKSESVLAVYTGFREWGDLGLMTLLSSGDGLLQWRCQNQSGYTCRFPHGPRRSMGWPPQSRPLADALRPRDNAVAPCCVVPCFLSRPTRRSCAFKPMRVLPGCPRYCSQLSVVALLLFTEFAGCCPIRMGILCIHYTDRRLMQLGLGHWCCVDRELGVVGERLLLDPRHC